MSAFTPDGKVLRPKTLLITKAPALVFRPPAGPYTLQATLLEQVVFPAATRQRLAKSVACDEVIRLWTFAPRPGAAHPGRDNNGAILPVAFILRASNWPPRPITDR